MNGDQFANDSVNQGSVNQGDANEQQSDELAPGCESLEEMEVTASDPADLPEPDSSGTSPLHFGAAAGIVIIACVATVHFLTANVGSRYGATLSATAESQQRQAEIRAAMGEPLQQELGILPESKVEQGVEQNDDT